MALNTNIKPINNTEPPAAAIEWLRHGFYAQAFAVLSELADEKDSATQFALGLCYLHAGEYNAAIINFENALRFIKAAPVASTMMIEKNMTYIKLYNKQIEERFYLTPFDSDFCAEFPKSAEQTVLLAMIYTYQKKGMVDRVLRLSSGLIGSIFEIYKNKLQESVANGN